MGRLSNVLVTDRTAEDVAAGNEKGVYSAADLNRVLQACSWLAEQLEARGCGVPEEYTPAVLASASAQPPQGGRVRGGLSYPESEITVTAEAAENYRFRRWQEGVVSVSTLPEYSFIAEKSRDLVALFDYIGRESYGIVGIGNVGLARLGRKGE